MIFNDKLLRLGEDGGKRAANLLHAAVHAWALENVADCPRDVKIMVRAYADVEGLAEVCTKAGLVPSPDRVADFICGFTRGKLLFDFTDVGMGKDRADGKLNGKHARYVLRLTLTRYRKLQALHLRLSLPPSPLWMLSR